MPDGNDERYLLHQHPGVEKFEEKISKAISMYKSATESDSDQHHKQCPELWLDYLFALYQAGHYDELIRVYNELSSTKDWDAQPGPAYIESKTPFSPFLLFPLFPLAFCLFLRQ